MDQIIKEHDMVALLSEMRDDRLGPGDIGTVVLVHGENEAFEVEFPNPSGKPRYIVVTVLRENLLKLQNLDLRLRAVG